MSSVTLVRSAHRSLRSQSKRTYHDLVTTPSRKPVVSYGPPGYSAATGHVVTVFGCTGFLGRYLVSKLGKLGTQVVIPYRDEDEKRLLKPMGDLGKIVPMEWDIRNEQQIEECVRHSDVVFNLVGRQYETKNFTYDAVHTAGAERIARIAALNGVEKFVQVSHLNADVNSPSEYYASKARGEELVKEAFPTASIIRPGAMYGYEDKLLNNMASWPIWWKLNYGETLMRPAHVMDVAQALANLVHMSALPRTINLPGPSTFSHDYMLQLVESVTLRPPSKAPVVPKKIALALADVMNKSVWWPVLSPDEVVRRYIDDVDVAGDWDVTGVTPTEIEQHAIRYLRRYRSYDNVVRPVVFPPRPEPESISA